MYDYLSETEKLIQLVSEFKFKSQSTTQELLISKFYTFQNTDNLHYGWFLNASHTSVSETSALTPI